MDFITAVEEKIQELKERIKDPYMSPELREDILYQIEHLEEILEW